MLRWSDEGLISFEEFGCEMEQLADDNIVYCDDECAVLNMSAHLVQLSGTFYRAIPEEPARLFVLNKGSYEVARTLYQQIVALSVDVFRRGVRPAESLSSASEVFEPQSDELEPVPADMLSPEGHYFKNITIDGRRFSCLTLEGVAAKKDAREAAERAHRERLAAEREAADEAARKDQEEKERLAKEEVQKRRQKWLDDLPPNAIPGMVVMDMREVSPRVGLVEYAGVERYSDGSFSFQANTQRLPNQFSVRYSMRKRDFPDEGKKFVWDELSQEDEAPFRLEDHRAIAALLPYEGPEVTIGSRVLRIVALDGRCDPFSPRHGNLATVILDIIGNEHSDHVDKNFSIDNGFGHLRARRPMDRVRVPVEWDDDEPYDDDGCGTRFSRKTEMLNLGVDERYARLLNSGVFLDGPYDGIDDWSKGDRRELDRENDRRKKENANWLARRQIVESILVALGASITPPLPNDGRCYDNVCNYGRDGIRARLAINEFDLDRLLMALREQNCQVIYYGDEQEDDFVARYTVATEKMDRVLSALVDCSGSPSLLMSMIGQFTPAKPIEFVAEGLLPAGDLALLVAPQKLGKSVLSLNLAGCVATGREFLGLGTQKGKVIFVHAEDSDAVIARRRMDASELFDGSEGTNFLPFRISSAHALAKLLNELEQRNDIKLVIVDPASAFVSNTSDGSGANAFMKDMKNFAEKTGACVLVVHHSGKDLPAHKARSPEIVFSKMKGSGEFSSVARATITLHLATKIKDRELALRTGERAITLHCGNMPSSVPVLRGSLAFKLDAATGILREVEPAVVQIPSDEFAAEGAAEADSRKPAAGAADANEAASVVNRLQVETGRNVPRSGGKSLYYIKDQSDLKGWTRTRCEQAHRLAVEMGLIEPV